MSSGEPLSEELEKALSRAVAEVHAWYTGRGEGAPRGILRAFAREILQNAEFEKGCECDSCCRLEELRVKVHLPEASADEIAGSIGHILDGQLESLQELWPIRDQLLASQESEKRLRAAIEDRACACTPERRQREWNTEPWEIIPATTCWRCNALAYRDSGREPMDKGNP